MGKILQHFITIMFLAMGLVSSSYAQVPVINSFSPAKGPVGTVVDITGNNFNVNASANVVSFGATHAKVLAATATSLKVAVPVGATFEPISVVNTANNLAGYSGYPFHVTFASKGTITALDLDARVDFLSGEGPASVAVGDLDGDGKVDIVAANRTENTISIYRNIAVTGSINALSLAPKFEIATNFSPNYVEIADVDGDGKLDIAVANNSSNNISVYKNQAIINVLNASSFAPKVDFATATYPYVLKLGDLDSDGRPDVAVSYNYVGTTLSVLKNTSSGGSINNSSFGPKVDLGTGNGYFGVGIADVNDDGKPELLLTSSTQNIVSVFNNVTLNGNLETSSFEQKVDFMTENNPLVVNTGDMDGDGKTDLILSNFGYQIGPNSTNFFYLSVLLNNTTTGTISNNSFGSPSSYLTGRIPQASAVGDLDGDGKLDMISTNYDSESITIYHNRSQVGTLIFDSRIDIASGVNPQSVRIADVDGDGKSDIVIANNLSNTISIYRNNASNTQSITFPALSTVVYGSPDFNAGAITNSKISPLVYTSSDTNVATISAAGVIHTTGVGSTTITVTQAGNASTDAAPPVSQTLFVTRAPLIIKADNVSRPYNTANPTLTATYTGLVNGDNAAVINANLALATPADAASLPGGYPITISGDATSANYNISYTPGVLTVNKLSQTITFAPLANKTIQDADFALEATASSGLQIVFSVDNNAIVTITGNIVHIIKVGSVTITATQSGNDIYEPASLVQTQKISSEQVIMLSNTITPNGDGINDTWTIYGLDYDITGTVSIFNRNGAVVFQSKGYPKPFDGTRNGKRLPEGTYYYIINFTDGRNALSGSLTIIY